ncbi:MAG: hypothetical protein COB54_07585 [Alphaproteobacteria bacterium]|nr:MAG: hypothetical protein COB54_07585 [Alphaproteobacteria bacterium]
MTIIINYNLGGTPIFHGDALITCRVDKAENEVKLPVRRKVNGGNCTIYVTKLVQKLVIVTPQVAFAWAGSLSEIKEFHELLCEKAKYMPPLLLCDDDELSSKLGANTSVILMCMEGTQGVCSCHGVDTMDMPGFGEINYAGSGAGDYLGHIGHYVSGSSLNISQDIKSGEDIVGLAKSLSGSLTALQMQSGYGLDNSWGGALETMWADGGGFNKVDDILYLFWTVHKESGDSYRFGFDRCLVKLFYHEDNMYCRFVDEDSARDDLIVIPSLANLDGKEAVKTDAEILKKSVSISKNTTLMNIVTIYDEAEQWEAMATVPVSSGKYFRQVRLRCSNEGEFLHVKYPIKLVKEILKGCGMPIHKNIRSLRTNQVF